MIYKHVTRKAKTDTNDLPFNENNHLLSVKHPFKTDRVKCLNGFIIRL